MEALLALTLAVFIAACAIAIHLFARRVADSNASAQPEINLGRELPAESPAAPPFVRKNDLFSAAEAAFHQTLLRLAPEHTVLAKVRLADLVRVQAPGREFWQLFNSIAARHVDFVLCDERLTPVVVIELDDSSDPAAERVARDQFVDSVLETAMLPVVHVRARRSYVLEELRQLLARYIGLDAGGFAGSGSCYVPARALASAHLNGVAAGACQLRSV